MYINEQYISSTNANFIRCYKMFVTNNLQSITLYIDFRLEHNTSTVKHD